MLDEAEQVLDLLDLQVRRFQDLRTARVVIDNGNTEDLQSHLKPDFSTNLVIFDCFLKFGDRVVIFIRKLPPLRAKLGY